MRGTLKRICEKTVYIRLDNKVNVSESSQIKKIDR